MSITQPKNSVPIGQFTAGGKRVDVNVTPEFNRFFDSLVRRLGGPGGVGVGNVQETAENALFIAMTARQSASVQSTAPAPAPSPGGFDDDQNILATRSFGR